LVKNETGEAIELLANEDIRGGKRFIIRFNSHRSFQWEKCEFDGFLLVTRAIWRRKEQLLEKKGKRKKRREKTAKLFSKAQYPKYRLSPLV